MRPDPKYSSARLWASALPISIGLSGCDGETLRAIIQSLSSDAPAARAEAADGGATPTYPCAGVKGEEPASDADLPVCSLPLPTTSVADCADNGFYYHTGTGTCVDACVDGELLTALGECCVLAFDGNCCPSNRRDENGTCETYFTTQGTGLRSSPNPCPQNRPILKCSEIGSCHCSSTR